MTFLKLSSLWLLLLIPLLVLLYFLKLKRTRLAVPSLVLWRKVVNDSRVNSPFQKFKRNILLFLQLLLLLLLIFAAMEPFFRGDAGDASRLPILIDRSASMAAVDDKGVSRLALVKEQLRQRINGLNPNEELCLIAFSKSAQQAADFTSNKRELLKALEAIEIEDVPSDPTDALRMAEALSRSSKFDRVLLMSDGNFPPRIDFELPFKLDYPRLPAAGPNMGITALSARRVGAGWTVFVNLQCTADSTADAVIELLQDGEARSAQQITPTPGVGRRITFAIAADRRTSIEVRLKPDGIDSLPNDNVAFMELLPLRPLTIYCPANLQSYRAALAAIPDVDLDIHPKAAGDKGLPEYDLVITDRPDDPAGAAWRVGLFVGFVPGDLSQMLTMKSETGGFVDWRRNVPILEHVELSDVVLLDQTHRAEGLKEEDLEALRYEVIAYGRRGPLMLAKREGIKQSYHLLFHSDRSTLPFRVGFPVMVERLVRQTMQEAGILEVAGDRTGVLPPVALTPRQNYDVAGPQGYTTQRMADDTGLVTGVYAPKAGAYTIGGETGTRVGVSLLDSSETLLAAAERIIFAEGAPVAAGDEAEANRSLWPVIVLLAAAVMLIEWWFYQRKPGGFSR